MWQLLCKTYSQEKNNDLQVEQKKFNLQKGDKNLGEYFSTIRFIYEKCNVLHPPCEVCKSDQECTMVDIDFYRNYLLNFGG